MVRFRNILFCLLLVALVGNPSSARFLTDKQAKSRPRRRVACLASPTFGTRYLDPNNLIPHAYGFALLQSEGIVYTCRGGHVDLTHVRKTADWTAYLAYRVREALLAGDVHLTFKMHERSRYYVELQYPANWKQLSAERKEKITEDVSIKLGQYFAYLGCTWHEILTWYGFKGSGFFPEYHSSFSWEDNYSNALGSYIGVLALRDAEHDFVEAMVLSIDRELQVLQVQPKETAKEAAESVRGSWFVGGYIMVSMVKRHLDIGLHDGMVTPWLIPDVGGCPDAVPQSCPVPTLAPWEEYGFRVKVEIEPREWEKGKILRAAYPDPERRKARIDPDKHLDPIMADIRATAKEKYGPHADECETTSTLAAARGAHDPNDVTPSLRDVATQAARWLTEDNS